MPLSLIDVSISCFLDYFHLGQASSGPNPFHLLTVGRIVLPSISKVMRFLSFGRVSSLTNIKDLFGVRADKDIDEISFSTLRP